MILRIVADVVQLYIYVLIARILLSWFPVQPWSNLAKVVRALARVTDPVLVPVRRVIPPVRVGGMAIDLAPLAVMIALVIIVNIL